MGGVYTRVSDVQSLRAGDHIAIWDFSRWPITYQHHGIVWASGDSPQMIQVCHVWSPLEDYQASQQDSCFRISTLEEFLYKRSLFNLRLVEYHTSGLREILSKWGEVHLSKSDLPEIVLARCKFLLGLGRGDFNIFTQNCEHAAHWCMTGEQWCKQNLTKKKARVPFEHRIPKEDVDALYKEIEEIKAVSTKFVNEVLNLSGSMVYLRVQGNKYIHVRKDKRVEVREQGSNGNQPCEKTKFRLECFSKGYNCIKVSFYHECTGCYMFSRSTFSCFRDLRMKKLNCCRGSTGMRWEYSSLGNLKSMNQHRRYVGIREDGILVDVSMRGAACRVEFVPCESTTGEYEPPDINAVTRKLNHQESIEKLESKSMREFMNANQILAASI
jgi:hypothetical protein